VSQFETISRDSKNLERDLHFLRFLYLHFQRDWLCHSLKPLVGILKIWKVSLPALSTGLAVSRFETISRDSKNLERDLHFLRFLYLHKTFTSWHHAFLAYPFPLKKKKMKDKTCSCDYCPHVCCHSIIGKAQLVDAVV